MLFSLWEIAEIICNTLCPFYGGFPHSSVGKSLPAIQETLEKGMATHSSVLAWRIPWTEEAGRLQPMGLQELYMTKHTAQMSLLYFIPLQFITLTHT